MSERPEKLMLLDSASLYFRAFYGLKESITAPDGTPVNAVRGFLDFITRLVTDQEPTRLVCCWDDDWRPDFRVAAIPSYKAHRVADVATDAEEIPDTLAPQVPVIADVLAAFGIARIGVAGYEADDVIGTLAARSEVPVDVVTGDRDLFQVVDDARRVRVLYTAKGGVARAELVGIAGQGHEGNHRVGAGFHRAAYLEVKAGGLRRGPGIDRTAAAAHAAVIACAP